LDISCDISIVIPAYNEQERLGPTLDKVLNFVRQRGWRAEVIVVDGASQDHTADLAQGYVQSHGIRLIRNTTNRGKGYCVRKGVMEARGRIILFTDADLSAPIEEAPKLLEALDAGADIAIGSRWMRSDLQRKRQSPARQVLGRAFNLLLRMVLTLDFKDTQCGFKAFRRRAAGAVFARQKIERWGFDPEILFLAKRADFKVAEVPVFWAHDSRTRIHPIADGLRMVCEILRIRWYALRGSYGESLVAPSSPSSAGNPGSVSVAESQAGD
jgi:dolichyl-phosphate beta-glucosyltransferase